MADAVNTPDGPSLGAQTPRDKAWPSVYSRHPASREADSVVDAADATAWSMPYTDLTMLLMVFFIVMLSIVGPDPAENSDLVESTNGMSPEATAELSLAEQRAADRDARSPIDGGDGIFLDDIGILPDGGAARVVREGQYDDPPGAPQTAETSAAQAAENAGETSEQASEQTSADGLDEAGETPGDMQDDAFAEAWARRINALEESATEFLARTGLENTITLNKTDVGIELRLPDDLLFSSGSADVQITGMDLLARITSFLNEIDGDIQVSGHTDDVPIQTARFPSNWELSAARAIAVVRLLRQFGIPETKMQAVGHGANRPIASNTHSVGRAINRRVTIDITPRPGAG